jgi:alanine dehydrogenase
MSEAPIWLTESDVVSLIDMDDAIAALEAGLAQEAAQTAHNMVKTHVLWNGGDTLHAIGAVFKASGFACTKTWTNTKLGSSPTLLLFDTADGSLKAVMEAMALGQLRTGGITGVATKWLAHPEASEAALIGTGKQALTQLAAIAAIRPLKHVRVFGRNMPKRDAFVVQARKSLGLEVTPASSIAEACDGATIVTAVTRATEPIITSSMLTRGTHFNAVGAITPERMEFAPDLLERADAIVVDSIPQARNLSREFMAYFGSDEATWRRVQPLSAAIAAGGKRDSSADLTVFKALGMGISDLSLAIEIFRRARTRELGHTLPGREKHEPRLTATQ